jgi:hypothetical protein
MTACGDMHLWQDDVKAWHLVTFSTSPLPARYGHSCSVLPDGKLLIAGGIGLAPMNWSEFFMVVDIESQTWTYLDIPVRFKQKMLADDASGTIRPVYFNRRFLFFYHPVCI